VSATRANGISLREEEYLCKELDTVPYLCQGVPVWSLSLQAVGS